MMERLAKTPVPTLSALRSRKLERRQQFPSHQHARLTKPTYQPDVVPLYMHISADMILMDSHG